MCKWSYREAEIVSTSENRWALYARTIWKFFWWKGDLTVKQNNRKNIPLINNSKTYFFLLSQEKNSSFSSRNRTEIRTNQYKCGEISKGRLNNCFVLLSSHRSCHSKHKYEYGPIQVFCLPGSLFRARGKNPTVSSVFDLLLWKVQKEHVEWMTGLMLTDHTQDQLFAKSCPEETT